jgi:pimeloyl-ACP methyl ester carboxylesterase
MTYHRLETKEGDRFYREMGDGEPILLLHCSAGSSSAWLPVMENLSQDYRVLAADLLGYGRSAAWPRDAVLAPDAELGVVQALINVAGRPSDGRVHLVGHSYGGAVAHNAARRSPGQIASLTLIEPVAFRLLRGANEPDGWREVVALADRHLALVGEGRDAEAAEAFTTYWMGRKGWVQMPDAARETAIRTAPKVAAEWRLMLAAEDDPEPVARIDAPTLLICGGGTRRPVRQVVEVLLRTLPDACQHEIADAGHMSPLTHPAAVAEAIRRHVEAVNAQRRSSV